MTPPLITQNDTVLNSNTDGSCFIDATFELLWHCVLSWVADSVFDKAKINASSNDFDKVLMRTYELHSSGTLEGRLEASKEIRNFVWPLADFKKGVWDDCSKLFNLFLDNLSPDVRSSCSFSEVLRFKQCTVDEFHNVYTLSRIPYFSFTSNFAKLTYRNATITCQRCIEEKRIDGNGAPGCLHCRNYLDENVEYPPFLFICNGSDFINESSERGEEMMPSNIQIENTWYSLHGRVYSTSASGLHFYSMGVVTSPEHEQFLAKFDNLADRNITKSATYCQKSFIQSMYVIKNNKNHYIY